MSQSQWEQWAQQRVADAVKMEKLYRTQGTRMHEVLVEKGCACNPIITFPAGGVAGAPTMTNPQITHALDCITN